MTGAAIDRARVARLVGWTIAAANVAFILVATLTPVAHPIPEPFATHCYFCGETGAVDVLLNLLLFMPLGFGLALAGRRWWVGLLVCFGLTAFVETMQLLVVSGRDASLSDITNNTAGGMIGFGLAAFWPAIVLPRARRAAGLAVAAALAWIALTVATAWAMAPAITGIAAVRLRSEGRHYAYFHGAVFGGDFAGIPIGVSGPDSLFRTPPGLPIVVTRQTPMTASALVTAGRQTDATSSIGGVFLGEHARLLLSQDRRFLLYVVRLNAARLLFRHPGVTIADVFPDSAGRPGLYDEGDTLRLWGNMVGDRLSVGATRVGPGVPRSIARTLVLSPFLGWTMILFWNLYASPALNGLLTALWVAALLVPCAYWSARARPATRWATLVPIIAAVAGVAGVPLALHRSPAAWYVWAGAALGVLVGMMLARGVDWLAGRWGGTGAAEAV